MCCLGFACEQLAGVELKRAGEISSPQSLTHEWRWKGGNEELIQKIALFTDGSNRNNSETVRLMTINDRKLGRMISHSSNADLIGVTITSEAQREEMIKKGFDKLGLDIVFEGEGLPIAKVGNNGVPVGSEAGDDD